LQAAEDKRVTDELTAVLAASPTKATWQAKAEVLRAHSGYTAVALPTKEEVIGVAPARVHC
jgi:hypothetical protein